MIEGAIAFALVSAGVYILVQCAREIQNMAGTWR